MDELSEGTSLVGDDDADDDNQSQIEANESKPLKKQSNDRGDFFNRVDDQSEDGDLIEKVPEERQQIVKQIDEPIGPYLKVNKKQMRKIKDDGHFGGKNVINLLEQEE